MACCSLLTSHFLNIKTSPSYEKIREMKIHKYKNNTQQISLFFNISLFLMIFQSWLGARFYGSQHSPWLLLLWFHPCKLLIWIDKNRGLYILVLNIFPSILVFFYPLKNFIISEQLGDRWHNWSKVLDKALIKLCHPIEHLDFLAVVGIDMFIKASTFLWSMTLPSLDPMKPKIVPKNTMNARLFGFRLIPNSLHLRKHFFSFSRWVDMSLKIVKSSRKIFMIHQCTYKMLW